MHYLQEDGNGELGARDHDVQTNVNQLLFTPVIVLFAISAFFGYVLKEGREQELLLDYIVAAREELDKVGAEMAGKDFELAEEI